jgi:hypothetical protein
VKTKNNLVDEPLVLIMPFLVSYTSMMSICTIITGLYVIFISVGLHELKYYKISIGMLQKGLLICLSDGYALRIMML